MTNAHRSVDTVLGILSKNLIRQRLDFWGYKTITKSRWPEKKYDFYTLPTPWQVLAGTVITKDKNISV